MKKRQIQNRLALLVLCASAAVLPAQSQTKDSTGPALGAASADPEALYKSCPEGYYSGPRPGRTRYTKDEYIWAVTPEFAAAYCMPPEFVDKNLKGAEAVAYKPVYEGYESCGFGGNKEVCGRGAFHGFEIYLRASTKLQSVSDTKFSFSALHMNAYSKHLLSSNGLANRTMKAVDQWFDERPGVQKRTKGWGLIGVKGPKPVWSIVALYEKQYIEDLLPGYNFISLFGSMGYFSNPRGEKRNPSNFVLVLDRLGDKREDEEKNLSTDYAHVIYLPEPFVEKVRQVDKQGAKAFDALVQRAMGGKQP